MPGRQFTNKF